MAEKLLILRQTIITLCKIYVFLIFRLNFTFSRW